MVTDSAATAPEREHPAGRVHRAGQQRPRLALLHARQSTRRAHGRGHQIRLGFQHLVRYRHSAGRMMMMMMIIIIIVIIIIIIIIIVIMMIIITIIIIY